MLTILEEIKVKNVIIGKQFESSQNYEEFIKIVKNKKIKLYSVEAGQKINIDKNTYIDILWPDSSNIIEDNMLNNNSLVCKINYKEISILFTGDIEEVAEKSIINKHRDNLEILKSDIIKIAHHGSKTSSYADFLKVVEPKIALIGVGKNNRFGHPSEITIENLKNVGCAIFRTDESGEIEIKIKNNRKILVNTHLKEK